LTVPCDYTVSGGVVTATPLQPLPYGTLIKCLITPALRGKHNERLDKDYSWQFRTVPDELKVTAVIPPDGTSADINIELEADFSHSINPATITADSFTVNTVDPPEELTVKSTIPGHGAENISPDIELSAEFSHDINADTVTADSFIVETPVIKKTRKRRKNPDG